MSEEITPEFTVRKTGADISLQIRVQKLANGFLVRTGGPPVHFSNLNDAADAVRRGIIAANWKTDKGNTDVDE